MYCSVSQKEITKQICNDCGTYFESHAAVQRHRKWNKYPSLVHVADGNMSEKRPKWMTPDTAVTMAVAEVLLAAEF